MRRVTSYAILLFALVAAMPLCALAADVAVPGADAIAIKSYFDAPIEAPGLQAPVKTQVVSGKLPYGLRLTAENRITGKVTAVQRTSAKIRATGADGKSAEADVAFAVVDPAFRLLVAELPTAQPGKTTTVKIEGQGGTPPYSGCTLKMVRTFTDGGAAKWGAKAPSTDAAPAWLKLSDDCTLTATPDGEAVVLMVVAAKDSAGAEASEFYALRSAADPAQPGWLQQKAREYNKDYQERFSPNGLTLERRPGGGWHAYGDSAIWSGTYLGGAAYYYAVTGEDYARANVEKSLNALVKLRDITGMPGLIGRAFEGEENTNLGLTPDIKDAPERHSYVLKDGPYKGWRLLSTASRDQFTGVLWGSAAVWELFDDPDLRAKASANIVSMAGHVWDNKMHIMESDGTHTRHGVMSGWGIQDSNGEKSYDPYAGSPLLVPNGMNAAMLLDWFNMAATVAPEEQARKLWRSRVLAMVSKDSNPEPGRKFERDYLSTLKKLYIYGEEYNTYWETAWFNLNLFFNTYFYLTRFEKEPRLREKYRDVMKFIWKDKKVMADGCEDPEARRAGRERNPYFTWQYLAAQGDREPDKIFNAVSTLMTFPRGPKTPFKIVDPIEMKAIPGKPDWACEPVPPQYRIPEDFYWQRAPYHIGDTALSPGDWGREFAGVDVITPYWMGRWFGFIPGNI